MCSSSGEAGKGRGHRCDGVHDGYGVVHGDGVGGENETVHRLTQVEAAEATKKMVRGHYCRTLVVVAEAL